MSATIKVTYSDSWNGVEHTYEVPAESGNPLFRVHRVKEALESVSVRLIKAIEADFGPQKDPTGVSKNTKWEPHPDSPYFDLSEPGTHEE